MLTAKQQQRQLALLIATAGHRFQLANLRGDLPLQSADIDEPKVSPTTAAIQQLDPSIEVDVIEDCYRARQQIGEALFCCVDPISTRGAFWRSAGKLQIRKTNCARVRQVANYYVRRGQLLCLK